jgi:SAM-dependent methyltransferase
VDVRRLELRFDEERGTVTIVDATGEHSIALAGEAFARVRAAATAAVRAAAREARPRRPDPAASPAEACFWETLYAHGSDGWELMRAAPPLEHWFNQFSPAGKRALVVGCGRGHEARLLAERGASVVAVDFAATAIAEAERLTPPALRDRLELRTRDLFLLPQDGERYDLVVEHCCFCAIEPSRRGAYVEVMATLLVDGGQLVGLFWDHGGASGPPFAVRRGELEQLFAARFDLIELTVPRDSVPTRQGEEMLAVFRRR